MKYEGRIDVNAATKLPGDVGPIHFVGIGGIGVSVGTGKAVGVAGTGVRVGVGGAVTGAGVRG